MEQQVLDRASLSPAQRAVVEKMAQGATLVHEVQTTGKFRLCLGDESRTVHPALVMSLIAGGVLRKDLLGRVQLQPEWREGLLIAA